VAKIAGGNSIEPIKGFYRNEPIDELDVKGMYPTIAIAHNISFETVNCTCCFFFGSSYCE
jgi:DNA polymerase, archaea type